MRPILVFSRGHGVNYKELEVVCYCRRDLRRICSKYKLDALLLRLICLVQFLIGICVLRNNLEWFRLHYLDI